MSDAKSPGTIIGSVFERKPGTSSKQFGAPKPTSGTASTGFPSVQHRSKSAFARSREENLRKSLGASRLQTPPVPVSASKPPSDSLLKAPPPPPAAADAQDDIDSLREQISRENEARIAQMTPEEIEEERRQILERFGSGITTLFEKAKQNRMKRNAGTRLGTVATSPLPPVDVEASKKALQTLEEVPISPEIRPAERARSPPPPALASSPGSRPSSRASRRLRFAELEPQDVFVYESHPPSPKRSVLALPPPTKDDQDAISLGQWHGRMAPSPMSTEQSSDEMNAQKDSKKEEAVDAEMEAPVGTPEINGTSNAEPDEGTPEYIRRRYFPGVPANDPNLAWISQSSGVTSEAGPSSSSIRFDLHGNPIPPALSSQLPTSLGLHHHAEGSSAGYTLDDIFLLSRSTVPAQRTVMFGILAGIIRLLSKSKKGEDVPYLAELKGQEEELRKRIVAAGAEALNEKGSVGLRAIDLVWECVVGWDEDLIALGLEGIWLESADVDGIRSLSLVEFVLPSISDMVNQNRDAYPHETLTQLLQVVRRLSLENGQTAQDIVATDKLLSGIVQCFLLAPHAQDGSSHLPHPDAISLLVHLAKTSRETARALAQAFSDDLLRFVTILPESSPFPAALASTLMTLSLNFYAVLGSYGLSTGIASAAMEHISRVSQYATSSPSAKLSLSSAWARLAEVWIACSIDPHVTTPPHDITWSRTSAWRWHTELIGMLDRIDISGPASWVVWGDVWATAAAWLEGSRVNGVRGGEKEREEVLQAIKPMFGEGGRASTVISLVLDSLASNLQEEGLCHLTAKSIGSKVKVLRSAVRLCLASLPPHLEGPPDSPPFDLPYDRISSISATLLSHPIWTVLESPQTVPPEQRYFTVYLRQVSAFLSQYLNLSRRLPAVTKELWLAQAFSVVLRLIPGDEQAALTVIGDLLRFAPDDKEPQEKKAGAILEPFMRDAVMAKVKEIEGGEDDEKVVEETPQLRTRLGPLTLTPSSIGTTTTGILVTPFAGPKTRRHFSALPLARDWPLSAMDHLLHSGESVVFKHLPADWDASEVEVTRLSFGFALTSRDILNRFKLAKYALDENEAILGCMKVFMLEHGLEKESVTSAEEVFRDKVVERLMEALLEPYRLGFSKRPPPPAADLEKAATRFLGTDTPFYQFYADFIGLYDAISFSHPLFGLLLLPPTSMEYAIDYRKLFWSDYPQILRTIIVYPNQVLSSNLKEYLYPVEKDPQVIGSFLSALVKNGAREFLHLVAIHHIAANIWIDLRELGLDGRFDEERGVKLLKTVVDRGDKETVFQVVKYWQDRGGNDVLLAPECFRADEGVLGRRREWVARAVGSEYAERLGGLLSTN